MSLMQEEVKKKKKKEKPCNCDHKPFHPQYCTGFGKPYGADRVGVIKQIPLFTEVCLGPALLLQAAFWCLHTHTHMIAKCEQNLMSSFTSSELCVCQVASVVSDSLQPYGRDCSPPGSSVHGILQARILEWLPWPPPGDLPDPGIEPTSLMPPALAGGLFTTSATRGPCKGILAVYAQNISPLFFRTCPKQTKLSLLKTIIRSRMDINPVYIPQILSRWVPAPTCWSTLISSRHRPV